MCIILNYKCPVETYLPGTPNVSYGRARKHQVDCHENSRDREFLLTSDSQIPCCNLPSRYTQLASTFARNAFPCLDEPALKVRLFLTTNPNIIHCSQTLPSNWMTSYLFIKILQAEFTMYVGRSPDYRSLSNMPLKTVRMCYQAWAHICTVSDNSTALWRPLGEGLVVGRVLPVGEDVLLSGGSRRCLAVQVPWVRACSGRSNH